MSKTPSRLGRGLGALIAGATTAPQKTPEAKAAPSAPSASPATTARAATNPTPPASGFSEIAVAAIEPNPYQPRKTIAPEHLAELADSIRSEGLLQPIVVRKVGEKFQLIAGERRWRAFQKLQIKTIPARVIDASDTSSATLALIENLQREGLNPIEEAYGYASLIRDFDLTQEATAERVGKARASVANALRLLQLDGEIQGFVSKNLLSVGHAKVLLGVATPAERTILARRVIEDGLSVRALEAILQRNQPSGDAGSKGAAQRPVATDAALANIERRLTSHLGARVALKHGAKRGKLIIQYQGNDDLQRILSKLGVNL